MNFSLRFRRCLGLAVVLLVLDAATALMAQRIRYFNPEGTEVLLSHLDPVTGDTIPEIRLRNVYCFNRKRFRGRNQELAYWRMVNDVKKTLPVAKEARHLLKLAYDTCQVLNGKQERQYFKLL